MGLQDLIGEGAGLLGIARELKLLREAVERVAEALETKGVTGKGLLTGPAQKGGSDNSSISYFGEISEREREREREEFEARTGLRLGPGEEPPVRAERQEVPPHPGNATAGWFSG